MEIQNMSLSLLPALTWPITPKQIDGLMVNLMQLNTLEAGIPDRVQKALDIVFDVYELKAKSKGTIDYTGEAGENRLVQEAITFVPEQIVTKHRDLDAAHLAIAFNNAQVQLSRAGMPLLPNDVPALLVLAKRLLARPVRTEQRIGLFLSYLQKKSL